MPPADRRALVAERRAASERRFDTIHSPRCDENWGAISPSHAAFTARLAAAGFTAADEADADHYWHLLLRRND